MTHYLGDGFLLLLLPTKMVIGRPHLRGSPQRLGHSMGLSLTWELLCLWLALIRWDQEDQMLHGSHQVLHRLVPLGDFPVPKLDLYGSNYTFLRREHPGHLTQAVSCHDLGFILY